jgi:hypothetical protein
MARAEEVGLNMEVSHTPTFYQRLGKFARFPYSVLCGFLAFFFFFLLFFFLCRAHPCNGCSEMIGQPFLYFFFLQAFLSLFHFSFT